MSIKKLTKANKINNIQYRTLKIFNHQKKEDKK